MLRDDRGGAGVVSTGAPFCFRWYAPCIAAGMLNMLTTPALTVVFLGVVVSLGTAFVWMLWEIERMLEKPLRSSNRFR
jgi:hypothetical protein